jgi:hypothetical protein
MSRKNRELLVLERANQHLKSQNAQLLADAKARAAAPLVPPAPVVEAPAVVEEPEPEIPFHMTDREILYNETEKALGGRRGSLTAALLLRRRALAGERARRAS